VGSFIFPGGKGEDRWPDLESRWGHGAVRMETTASFWPKPSPWSHQLAHTQKQRTCEGAALRCEKGGTGGMCWGTLACSASTAVQSPSPGVCGGSVPGAGGGFAEVPSKGLVGSHLWSVEVTPSLGVLCGAGRSSKAPDGKQQGPGSVRRLCPEEPASGHMKAVPK